MNIYFLLFEEKHGNFFHKWFLCHTLYCYLIHIYCSLTNKFDMFYFFEAVIYRNANTLHYSPNIITLIRRILNLFDIFTNIQHWLLIGLFKNNFKPINNICKWILFLY